MLRDEATIWIEEVIDAIVTAAIPGKFGDERDGAFVELTFANFPEACFYHGARAYRARLRAMSMDELTRELESAAQGDKHLRETLAYAAECATAIRQSENREVILKELKENARRGGSRSKRIAAIDEFVTSYRASHPKAHAKNALAKIITNPYTTNDGCYTVSASDNEIIVTKISGNIKRQITQNSFKSHYWNKTPSVSG